MQQFLGVRRGLARDRDEALEGRVVADGQDKVPVRGGHHLIWHDVRVVVPEALRHLARRQVVHALVREQCRRHIKHGDVDVLPDAGERGVPQRRENAHDAMHAGDEVDDRDADLHGLAVGRAGERHDATHGLDEGVVARPLAVRPGLAEAGDRAIHKLRVITLQGRVTQTILVQGPNLEVLNENIASREETANNLLPLRLRVV
mmetsp:Transcript_132660/g.383556  ORF Transcript_132660/g.383556 Transcript_132660/m.383556 type:complete len:203 (+) Transcript_132660:599-1207(+)